MSIQLPKIKVNVKNNEKNKESIFCHYSNGGLYYLVRIPK